MKKGSPDYIVLVTVIALVIFGMLMVFSATYYNDQMDDEPGTDGYSFLKNQVMGVSIGLVLMIILSFIDYHFFQKFFIPFISLFIGIILLILVFTKLGVEIHGSRRWLKIGSFKFQPSEATRVALMLYAANFMATRSNALRTDSVKEYFKITGPVVFFLVLVCGLIIAQPNLSMMLSVLAVIFCIMVASGTHTKPLLSMIGVGVAAGAIFIFISEFRMRRMRIFMDPWKDPQNSGYQLVQSLYALGSGGLKGVGLGNSLQKHLYLTFGESDFILSIIGEELGFIGVVLLMGIFILLIYRGIKIAQSAPDNFGLLLATGIVSMIAIQLIIHVAVITSSMPPTGMPLPFISHGNTSLIMFMGSTGILLNISRQSKREI